MANDPEKRKKVDYYQNNKLSRKEQRKQNILLKNAKKWRKEVFKRQEKLIYSWVK